MRSPLRPLRFLVILLSLFALFGTSRSGTATSPTLAQAETVASCPLVAPGFITWSPAEIECPICQTKNIFMVWGSYGNYIYQFPSKYQLLFWPYTDSQSWYSCSRCHFSAFMEDFKNVPKDKVAELKKMLEAVSLSAQKGHDYEQYRQIAPYLGIAVSDRLAVVEKVDGILGRTGDDHWSHFYRVLAYHFAAEKKQPEADEARRKVLGIIERLLADKANDNRRKNLLYISAAMHHYLRDDDAALKDFEAAKKLKYSDRTLKAEQNKNYDDYLTHLIDEYTDMIHKGKGPRERPESAFID